MSGTQQATTRCQVLVVGSGPSGLVLAAQLLARGMSVRVIDKGDGPASQSRAVSIHARTLELLDTMGLAETFVEHGHEVRRFHLYAGNRTLLDLDMARNGSRYGFMLHLPQSQTERLLRIRLNELGGTVEQRVELVRLVEQADGVEASLRDVEGQEIRVSADYVVGCDGAHSRVRQELGLAFQGQAYPQDFLLADVAVDGLGRDDEVHSFFRQNGLPLVCLPMGGQRWRLVMPNAGDRAGRPPSFAEIQDVVAQRAPRRIEVSDPRWLACFRCQLRSVATYRRGRVLVAGDAAHIHSPAGGQGMNTGMLDAYNLAWKLALVAGGAPDGLLDSYGQERLPVAKNVLGLTDRMMHLATLRNPLKRAVRDTLLPTVTALPMVQNRAARRFSQVSVAYPHSPLIRPDSARRRPRPGDRVSDVEVRAGDSATRLYRVLRRGRHVLLLSDDSIQAALEARGLDLFTGLVDIVAGDVGARHRPGEARSATFALVRPDGILAARGSQRDVHKVINYLGQISAANAGEPADVAGPH
jgi:2-polyprenyl-6-methoxyphenol hydroxylase-like FAD-dependent oxidoreductase